MVFVTGDTHRHEIFDRFEELSWQYETTTDDVLIILGDVGINFHGEASDFELKKELAELPITLLCIHGNHEQRPETIHSYELVERFGGIVYMEDEFPNLLFAKDGEIYDLDGKSCIAIGGAYSVDKHTRTRGVDWWDDEQPSEEIKFQVEEALEAAGWKVDVVLSHTHPYNYAPKQKLPPQSDSGPVDISTELWLTSIEARLDYSEWFCGHSHTDQRDNKLIYMYRDIRELVSALE